MNISHNLNVLGIPNIRDLGGIKTIDGRHIRNGVFLRSESLDRASEESLMKLENITKIYDFRSPIERANVPDKTIKGSINLSVPILDDYETGATEEQNDLSAGLRMIETLKVNPHYGFDQMIDIYRLFIESENARTQYSFFLKDMLETFKNNPSSSFLFHCTSGKDRCGFATALLLEIMGVDRNDIYDDYLSTNDYLTNEYEKIMMMTIGKMTAELDEAMLREAFDPLIKDYCAAKREYLDCAYSLMEERYGDALNYIREALVINDKMIEEFRDYFLE